MNADVSVLPPGSLVSVRSRFVGAWCDGFEVASVESSDDQPRYRIRRLTDGWVLPESFTDDDLAPLASSTR